MTFGGGVAGIGFDLMGLGDGGLSSLISMQECNQERRNQREDLAGQHDDRLTNTGRRRFENRLVVPVLIIQVASRRLLHLAEICLDPPGGFEQLASKKADADAAWKERKATLPDTQRIGNRSCTEGNRNNARPMAYGEGDDRNNDRGGRQNGSRLLTKLVLSLPLGLNRGTRQVESKFLRSCVHRAHAHVWLGWDAWIPRAT